MRVHLELALTDVGSPGHRLQGIILDISSNRLIKAVQKQRTARFWMSHSPIKALALWMLATFWIRSPSKVKSLRTFNTRSRHAFPIAIPVLLLPNWKSSITQLFMSHQCIAEISLNVTLNYDKEHQKHTVFTVPMMCAILITLNFRICQINSPS